MVRVTLLGIVWDQVDPVNQRSAQLVYCARGGQDDVVHAQGHFAFGERVGNLPGFFGFRRPHPLENKIVIQIKTPNKNLLTKPISEEASLSRPLQLLFKIKE